jgi:hypothetical protein
MRQLGARSFRATALTGARSVATLVRPAQHKLLASTFLTQQRFVANSRLKSSCKAELQEEMTRDDKTVCPQLPAGWTVNHAEGTNFFQVRKTYQDETLEVYCQLTLRDPELVADKSSGNQEHIPFTLVITKGGKALDFTLSAIDGELVLDGIAFLNDPALARDMSAEGMGKKDKKYAGPAVPELNDELVDSFIAYLEERGVDDSFAEFIEAYSFWMEQQEYEAWLGQVADFAS